MDLNDPQLVQLITQEVIKVLQKRGQAPLSTPHAAHAAEVRPPIGICTGDYSKFPELAGKIQVHPAGKPLDKSQEKPESKPASASGPTPAPAPIPAAPVAAPKPQPVPLTGIITANQLQSAIDSSPDGTALLALDARLSPLANDLARKLAGKIRRAGAGPVPSTPGKPDAALQWMWWIDGHCPVVQDVTSQRRDRLRPAGSGSGPTALPRVVRDLAGAVRNKQVAGGLLFVHNAARAGCFANRCVSLRAVVGTCGEAVEQGIADLGANVLIIEYPHHGYRSMSTMIDRFLQQDPRSSANVERDLGDLHRCT